MTAASLPDDEALRLDTLASYRIMDTPPDKSFDNLVKLAAEHFGVSVSLISMVDADRQWFKASVGMTLKGTPREAAFCAHAILRPDEILVVENAVEDPRFADNPLVTGDPAIRFYAGAPIRAENGQPLGTLCVIDSKARGLDEAGRRFLGNLASSAGSMLELHRKNLALSVASGRDSLTGLVNRRAFDAALADACAGLPDDGPFGLLMLDLDYFKQVNDSLGHEAGDRLLQEVARRLERVIRGKDVAARLGGDEFAVIAAGPVDLHGLSGMAQRIIQMFATDLRYGEHTVPIRTSIGVAMAPLHGDEPGILSRAADVALYRAKRAGRQSVVLASAAEGHACGAWATVEDELVAAIAAQTLSLHWQSYFETRTGELLGNEALLRWNSADGTQVSPVSIVEMAERGGFIADLDKMVLRIACAAAATWPQPLAVSVNMSAGWFSTDDLIGLVMAVLDETGLDPLRLTIELNERSLAQHGERVREQVHGLRARGIRIALDDFGGGYASLGCLQTLQFDILKLDRSFIAGLGINPRAEAVTVAILALGRALNVKICAEGVETLEQLRFLQANGCDMVQGFLLSHPQLSISWAGAAPTAITP